MIYWNDGVVSFPMKLLNIHSITLACVALKGKKNAVFFT